MNPLDQFEIYPLFFPYYLMWSYVFTGYTSALPFVLTPLIITNYTCVLAIIALVCLGTSVFFYDLLVPAGTVRSTNYSSSTSTVVVSSLPVSFAYCARAWQALFEELYESVLEFIRSALGPIGQRFFPLFFLLFTFLLYMNLTGMIAYAFTLTSQVLTAFFLSFMFFFGLTALGCYLHGFSFFQLFLPSGGPHPLPLVIFLVIVEFISYIARFFSLAIRLFANMMSGHTLVRLISVGCWLALTGTVISVQFASLFPTFLLVIILCLEIGVAMVQAYVFTMLVILYLNDILLQH